MSSQTPNRPAERADTHAVGNDETAAVDPQALAKALHEAASSARPAVPSEPLRLDAETIAATTANMHPRTRPSGGGTDPTGPTSLHTPLDPGAPMGGTPPGMMSFGRYCPACGKRTNEPYCPADGTQTLLRRAIGGEAMSVSQGDVIAGRYRITGVLGRGGFGAVYAAEHTGTQQRIALKMLLPSEDGADEGEVRRFYREAQVTAKLKHPNTVRVFDVGQTESGALYIAMELLHGPTLEFRLRELAKAGKVMSEREASHLAISVLRSLHEAHAQGLVHRDLKPANIILADSGDDETIIKVLDFGIARAKDSSLTGSGTALGTPAYMSPEQCIGTALDGRSDLYSLGIILYRCLVGQPPFTDPNPLTLMFQHAQAPVPDLTKTAGTAVSAGFCAVVTRSLAKDREQRFDSARSMRAALEGLAPGASDTPGLARALLTPAEAEVATIAQDAPGGREWEPTRAARPILADKQTMLVASADDTVQTPQRPRWMLWAGVAGAVLATGALVAVLAGSRETPIPAGHAPTAAPAAAAAAVAPAAAPVPVAAPAPAPAPAQAAAPAVPPPAAPAPAAAPVAVPATTPAPAPVAAPVAAAPAPKPAAPRAVRRPARPAKPKTGGGDAFLPD